MKKGFLIVAARLRAEGKLPSKKEVEAQHKFYRDVFADDNCEVHNNKNCPYCLGVKNVG